MARRTERKNNDAGNKPGGMPDNAGEPSSVIDPGAVGASADAGTAPSEGVSENGADGSDHDHTSGRRPRSDAGRRRGPRAEKITIDVDLAGIIFTAHAALASLTSIHELRLEQTEANDLKDKLEPLLKLYGADKLPPKVAAWSNFIICAAGIYGTRIMAYNLRKAQEPKPGPRPVAVASAPRPPQPQSNGAMPPNEITPDKPAKFTIVETPQGPARVRVS